MADSSVIQVRVDKELKKEAESLFIDLGLDTPSAIRLFLKQAIAQNGIPFPIIREPPPRPIAEVPLREDDFYNPHNMAHLKKTLADLNAGKGRRHTLIDDEEI